MPQIRFLFKLKIPMYAYTRASIDYANSLHKLGTNKPIRGFPSIALRILSAHHFFA